MRGNGQGTWNDSAGNAGSFAFFANTPGLPVRPLPASGLLAASVTGTQIAAGAIGESHINLNEVQRRVDGGCGVGYAMWAVYANGTVGCDPRDPPAVQFRAAGLASTITVNSGGAGVVINTWDREEYNVGGTYDAAQGAATPRRPLAST